jgi:hypothetical protein
MLTRRRFSRALVVGIGVATLSLTAVACGSDTSDSAATPTTVQQVPNLVGAWSGKYEFPSPSKGIVIPTALDLVIERAEGANLFGYESFVDATGKTIKFPLVGTAEVNAATGRADVVMTTTGFYIEISVVDADHLAARFVRTDDKPTTFIVNLTRKK